MKKAVILLSGGLDSVTALAIAKQQGFECYTLSFDYGQRHEAELKASAKLSKQLGAIEHKVIQIDLRAIGGSALTDSTIDVPEDEYNGLMNASSHGVYFAANIRDAYECQKI